MKFTVVLFAFLATAITSFQLLSTPLRRVNSLSMAVVDDFMPGQLAPLGFFDPLGLASKDFVSQKELKRWRESELKHGRIAMLAAVGMLVAEQWHPVYELPRQPMILGASVWHFQQWLSLTPGAWLVPLVVIFFAETFNIVKGWEGPAETRGGIKVAGIREDYEPGDFGFDPLNLSPASATGLLDMKNKELNHGRLAMLAVAGIVAQELVDGKTIWGHFTQGFDYNVRDVFQ